MGEEVQLKARDGHALAAYRAQPKGRARGAIVVIQEIFGVNSHIRALCDGFAADGYAAIAPALFDRLARGIEYGYTPDDIAKGRELRGKLQWQPVMDDTEAAIGAVQGAGRVGIVGYCYGGGVAWAAACRLKGLSASVGYYGGPWAELAEEKPHCAAMLHLGAKDQAIPLGVGEKMKALHPAIVTHVYEADHGFNCDQRGSYHPYSAVLARRRTLALFAAALD